MLSNPGTPAAIGRQSDRQTSVIVGTSAVGSTAVDLRAASGAQLLVPAGAASQSVAVYVCDTIDGTYVPLNNSTGAVAVSVVASNAYDLPEAIFAAHYVKFVAASTQFTGVVLAKG